MAKTRVHQLAKELGIDSKLIMEEAEKHGISVRNHMSALSDSDEMMIRAYLEPLRPTAPAPVVAPPAPRPADYFSSPHAEPLESYSEPDTDEPGADRAVRRPG